MFIPFLPSIECRLPMSCRLICDVDLSAIPCLPHSIPSTQQNDLMQREADYKRLNDELEAKTTSLFQETEPMLRQQEEYLAAAEKLESQGPEYYVDPQLDVDVDGAATNFGFSNALGRGSTCIFG